MGRQSKIKKNGDHQQLTHEKKNSEAPCNKALTISADDVAHSRI